MKTKSPIALGRRARIAQAGSTVFIVVAISAVVVVFSLVSVRFLWQRKSYNDRVITAKTEARDQLQSNITNIGQLAEQFEALNSSPTTNSTAILHALPPTYDYSALATSIQSLAERSGVRFVGSIGPDQSASAVTSAVTSQPQPIPLSLQVNGSYDNVVKFIKNLELSIRPISVISTTYTGTNNNIQAILQAETFYQPARLLDVTRRQIQ